MVTFKQEVAVLSPRILSQGIQSDKNKGHVAIYNHIHNRILPSTPSDADCPPLHVLAYVVRASILPTVVLGQMPRTLTQLAQIEHIRRLFAQRLDEILEADKKLRHDPDPMVMPLRSDWRIELKQMRNSVGRRLRRTFREIVNGFSLYHVYESWAVNQELDAILTMYFPIPSLWQEDVSGIEEQYLFHHKLTDDERENLEVTAQMYFDLLDKVLDDNPPDLSPEQFRQRYPRPEQADPERLTKLTLEYLDKLENAVQRVSDILETVED